MVRAAMLFCLLVTAVPAHAQFDGARVYWPLPKNFSILGFHRLSGTANASLVNYNRVQPSLDLRSELYLLTYTRNQPVLGRQTVFTAVLPAGTIESESSPTPVENRFVHGVGDASLGATINLFGMPGMMLREYLRYDLKSSAALGLSATFPVGQYNEDQPLNLGGNQYKIRSSLPLIHLFGPWAPGKRTTLEIVPAVTWVSDSDQDGGVTLEQDPLLTVESHLTRDVTRKAFLSFDYSFIRLGATTTRGESNEVLGSTKAHDAHLLGATAGLEVNDNLTLFLSHMQTADSDGGAVAFQGALFRMAVTWAWHPVVEDRRAFSD